MLRIGFLGAGNMAYALAGAVSEKIGEVEIIPFDINEQRLQLFSDSFAATRIAASAQDLSDRADIIIIAVKPQVLENALKPLRAFGGLAVSIAAGVGLAALEGYLPSAKLIRVMPNTPCFVGEMAAGYCAGKDVGAAELDAVSMILDAAGRAVRVEEELMDAVTGVSGSGPAYFARIAEAFIAAGVNAGLSEEHSRLLALQTMKGTAELMLKKDMSPEELVAMVSSPNGTTVAGREVLEGSDLSRIIQSTVDRTIERSKELGA